MVATLVLGTSAEGRAGSSPASGTKIEAAVRDTSCKPLTIILNF